MQIAENKVYYNISHKARFLRFSYNTVDFWKGTKGNMSEDIKFAHLHVHSEYSLLDGSAKIKELVSRTKELGMDSIALTDHGVMFGVIDFYKEAIKQGVKPILGSEVYVASGSRFNKDNVSGNFYYHLVLLAENNVGYDNIMKLVSYGFTEGYYYKPRVDTELLKQYSEGIIALSACLAGPVAKNIIKTSYQKAKEQAIFYNSIFGQGNFYLEMQDHGIADQRKVNQELIKISNETGIPLVCTNDCHYIAKEDSEAHDILLCIQTQKTINDSDRMRYEGNQFYVKSPSEMKSLFGYVEEGLTNTVKIADRCNVSITFHEYKLPRYNGAECSDPNEYLEKLCYEGLAERYDNIGQELRKRMDYELSVIKSMGFCDYFLITWDFIKYARDNGIMVGPGRGSAAGSLVAYCLHITNIDPIRYNLMFERFLNPERISMPDIDIDFCYERRQEVIDYVVNKYGVDRVAQIITFGTMAARGVIRDVGRALAMPYAEVDKIAKMIPFALGITIEKALEQSGELSALYSSSIDIKYLIDMSKKLEGLPRHASTHAAGVVICNRPVMEYVPLNVNDGVVTTQFSMTTLEELGLLKMDFLGLRTLTVIRNAVSEIKRIYNIDMDIDKIDFSEPEVYELISQGKTEGVFQLESSGMKQFMKELSPQCLEDIIAGISLYRPGPMDFIPKYVFGKNNPGKIQYTHKALEPILNTTYGCIVYQEQVMQIVRDLAGYSLSRSDLVRRAMSKKKGDVMAQERYNFVYGLGDEVPGCIKNGIDQQSAEAIFDDMTDFAKYAFNKSHAAAYAVVGYQTAWLKLHYKVEFMAALMTSVMDFTAKISEYIYECKKMNIQLLSPDVNEGYGHFSVSDGKIRYGLLAIKNVGRNTVLAIVAERERNGKYRSLTDFINRLEGKDLNKRCVESLIKAGAFDSLGGKRVQYTSIYKQILNGINEIKKRNIEGQLNLFDLGGNDDSFESDNLPDIKEFGLKELLQMEKEVMGIYMSGHPLNQYEAELKQYITVNSIDFINKPDNGDLGEEGLNLKDGTKAKIGGIIASKTVKYTKSGKAMAFLLVEDLFGVVEVIVFSNIYEGLSERLVVDEVILISGHVSVREDEDAKIVASEILFANDKEAERPSNKTLWLKIPNGIRISMTDLSGMLSKSKGTTPVIIYNESTGERSRVNRDYWVEPTDELLKMLGMYLGNKSVVLKSKKKIVV